MTTFPPTACRLPPAAFSTAWHLAHTGGLFPAAWALWPRLISSLAMAGYRGGSTANYEIMHPNYGELSTSFLARTALSRWPTSPTLGP